MCQHGQEVICRVWVCADDSHTGQGRWDDKAVDACLADQVNALNAADRLTRSCCCGHGKGGGAIILHDGTRIPVGSNAPAHLPPASGGKVPPVVGRVPYGALGCVSCCGEAHEIIQWTDAGPRQYGAECSICGRRIAEENPNALIAAFKAANISREPRGSAPGAA